MKNLIKKLLFLYWAVLLMLIGGQVFAQQDITGTVTDAVSGEPLPGVSIVVSGTTTGTITDINGIFNLSVPEGKNQLEFSMIGYSKKSCSTGWFCNSQYFT